ncbi:MAG: GNAT family N-acetyltransferase, partial [Bacteroidetes bacterium]|nr:GNAT family N-acetyltransferase [Bacteroidota bacterium]
MEQIIIKNISEETIDIYKTCFDRNGSPKNEENIKWQFLSRPNYKKYVDIAFDEAASKTAAIYAVSPVPFKIGENKVIGTQSLDTITDVDYRGKGWFIKLANSVYQKAANDGVALVYGFPNGNSIHGFKKKLDWAVLDPVPFLIKPLGSEYFTKKLSFLKFLPNIKFSYFKYKNSKKYNLIENRTFPVDVDRIWQNFVRDIIVCVNRNKEYLDWRYIHKPNENYRIIHCYDEKQNYQGFIVFVVKEKHDGKIGYIMELIYNPDFPETGKLLLQYANDRIRKQNADCILSWCMEHSPNYSVFKREFYINMPEKIRPIELHFGVRSFDEKFTDIVNKRENWYISYS